ncbi:MAG: porin family protein [Bacteroidales bacterium]|nr:porin family protein [Bacteroidales bacterium]
MKKSILLLLFVFVVSGIASAQKFYGRVGVGLAGGTSSSLDMLYNYTNDGTSQKISVVPVDLGSGFTGSLAFGYMLNKYVGFEFGLSQFLGFPNSGDSTVSVPGGTSATAKIAGSMLSFVPSVVITAGLEKVNPYARFGMVIGVMPRMFYKYDATQASVYPAQQVEVIQKLYGSVALGYTASLGVDFNINKLISLYAEASFVGCTWSPRYSELTKYDLNGVDQLSSLNTKQKETEFFTTIDLNEQIPDTSPDKELRQTYPFDNAGVNIGIRFKF